MTLTPNPSFPSARSYVLKLRFDAAPEHGYMVGRIEHIASGAAADFSTGEVLLAWLQAHASQQDRHTPAREDI